MDALERSSEVDGPAVRGPRATTGYPPAGEIVVLGVAGDLDLATVDVVAAALDEALARLPAVLVIDLTDVGFCDVRGAELLRRAGQVATETLARYDVSGECASLDRICAVLWPGMVAARHGNVSDALAATGLDDRFRPRRWFSVDVWKATDW